MRTPIRSEDEAVRFVYASCAVIAVSVLVGWLVEPPVGVAIFAVAAVAAAIAYLRADNPDRRAVLRDAAHEPHPHGARTGMRHVLVVANETLEGDELRDRINRVDGERVEVDVLAPVLASRLHSVTSDVDGELADARARLRSSLAWAQEHGIVAHGEVGDPSPTTAIEDELRDFGADEVIVVTHLRERETWQEHGELERLRGELEVPVTHITVGNGATTAATPV
ncbi:MAG: hypothetical protein ACLP50_13045 [Solirubrobacteraceae bacterium]